MKTAKGRIIANLMMLGTLVASTLGASSATADTEKLLKILLQNGNITQQQHDQLLADEQDEKQAAEEQAQAETLAAEEAAKEKAKDEVKISTKGGHLKFKSGDGDFKFQVGGRIMVDSAWYSNSGDNTYIAHHYGLPHPIKLNNGTELRRGRLFMSGTLWDVWGFKMQYDFADQGEIKDAYIRYTGLKKYTGGVPLNITAGHFKESFSLEYMASSKYITFMERALPVEAFTPDRNLGIGLNSYGSFYEDSSWTAALGVFGKGITADNDDNNEGYGWASRVTFTPYMADNATELIHLGGSFEYRRLKGQTTTVGTRPESHVANEKLVSATIPYANSSTKWGAETAFVYGPLSGQAEYLNTRYTTAYGPDANFWGVYGYLSWFITGESRKYKAKSGTFGRVTPEGIVGKGGLGST